MSEAIKHYLKEHFPESPPVSWALRQTYENLWFRIHSLPGSERYPENEDEFQEILRRDNTLCSDLFCQSNEIYLLLTEGSSSKKPVKPKYIDKSLSVSYVTSVSMREVNAENFPRSWWHIWSYSFHWAPGAIDQFLRQAALWKIVNLIVLDTQTHRLFCPYDGGSDVILGSSSERDAYKSKYKDWLSNHPSGL